MTEVQYLSFDSLAEGVGASQVLAYMLKVSKECGVTIVSFEKNMPSEQDVLELHKAGITWLPLPFGKFGTFGGLRRVFEMWKVVDRNRVIHARSTLAALVAMLRFPKAWIWDCRALQADQRRALSEKKRRTLVFVFLRGIEYALAKKATAIIVITKSVVPVLLDRYRIREGKITYIPTCVDMQRFKVSPTVKSKSLRILLAGTFSPAYDINLINKIIYALKIKVNVTVTIATSSGSTSLWESIDYDEVTSVSHDRMSLLIQNHDLGISLWSNDLGVCLKSVASTKTAEFLACGKPVFINSKQGDLGILIDDYGVGVATHGDSKTEIEAYCEQMLLLVGDEALPGRCESLLLENGFDLNSGVGTLTDLYSELNSRLR
jgi:hypothetical protein